MTASDGDTRDPGLPPPRDLSDMLRGALGALVYLMAGAFAARLLVTAGEDDEALRVEQAALAMVVAAVALAVFARFAPPRVPFGRPRMLGRATAIYGLFLVAWVPFVFWVYPALMRAVDQPLEPQAALSYFAAPPGAAWGPYVVVLLACVVGPLAEEVVFRGYIQQALSRVGPTWLAIVGTAALFGLVHGPAYALPVGLLGLLFGVLRQWSGSLIVPFFVHALHNTLTIVVTVVFPWVLEVYGG